MTVSGPLLKRSCSVPLPSNHGEVDELRQSQGSGSNTSAFQGKGLLLLQLGSNNRFCMPLDELRCPVPQCQLVLTTEVCVLNLVPSMMGQEPVTEALLCLSLSHWGQSCCFVCSSELCTRPPSTSPVRDPSSAKPWTYHTYSWVTGGFMTACFM